MCLLCSTAAAASVLEACLQGCNGLPAYIQHALVLGQAQLSSSAARYRLMQGQLVVMPQSTWHGHWQYRL